MKRLLILAALLLGVGCTPTYVVGDCVVDVSKHDPQGVGIVLKQGASGAWEKPIISFGTTMKTYSVSVTDLLTCKEYGL